MLYLDVLEPGMQVPHTSALTFWTCKCSRQCTRASRPAPSATAPMPTPSPPQPSTSPLTFLLHAFDLGHGTTDVLRHKVSTNLYKPSNSNVMTQWIVNGNSVAHAKQHNFKKKKKALPEGYKFV